LHPPTGVAPERFLIFFNRSLRLTILATFVRDTHVEVSLSLRPDLRETMSSKMAHDNRLSGQEAPGRGGNPGKLVRAWTPATRQPPTTSAPRGGTLGWVLLDSPVLSTYIHQGFVLYGDILPHT
jgi:hypothetical protein